MIIIIPQMSTFYTNCLMGFPVEDCRIYDISYMWPILLTQSILCMISIGIKCNTIKMSYQIYILLHEFKSPLLSYFTKDKYISFSFPKVFFRMYYNCRILKTRAKSSTIFRIINVNEIYNTVSYT